MLTAVSCVYRNWACLQDGAGPHYNCGVSHSFFLFRQSEVKAADDVNKRAAAISDGP
jgi:hypothetical protein